MTEDINHDRRRFLGTAAIAAAATQLGGIASAEAQSRQTKPAGAPAINTVTNASFDSLKQIDAGVLAVGYAEAGPANGPAVVLLHGWP